MAKKKQASPEAVFTTSDCARVLGKPVSFVRRMIAEGRIPATKAGRGHEIQRDELYRQMGLQQFNFDQD